MASSRFTFGEPRVVPAGWPPDVAPRDVITAGHINAVKSSVYQWPGNVDAQNFQLVNVGKVGIGTPAPDVPLTFAAGVGQKVQWWNTGNNYRLGVSIFDHGGSVLGARFIMPNYGNSAPAFQFGTIATSDGTTFAPMITINYQGSVGIGTTQPTCALEVRQNANRANVTFLNASGLAPGAQMRLRLGPTYGFDQSDLYPYFEAYSEGVSQVAGLAFGTFNGTSAIERLRITAEGAFVLQSLPSSNPGAGTKQLWYDPADGNRVKFAA